VSATNGNSLDSLVGAPNRPARARDCKELFYTRTPRADGTESARVTWCCQKRRGVFLKDMKCVGLNHHQCPNATGERPETRSERTT
jgi:hypothetical protein